MAAHHETVSPESSPVRAIVVASGFSLLTLRVAGRAAGGDLPIYQPLTARSRSPTCPPMRAIKNRGGVGPVPDVLSERELEPLIKRHSFQQQLHPALIRAVIKAESNFDPRAVSRAGPSARHAADAANRRAARGTGHVRSGRECGRRHEVFEQLLDRFRRNLPLALAAYNAGENIVDRYQSLPPIDEARQYVRKVLRYYRTFLVRDGVITERPVTRPAPSAAEVHSGVVRWSIPHRQPAVLLPSRPFRLRKVRSVMGPDAVLPPQRRFRNTLRHLHHVFDLERCALRKRLRDELRPARVAQSTNQRLADRMTPTCPHIVRRSELRNFSASSEPYCSSSRRLRGWSRRYLMPPP